MFTATIALMSLIAAVICVFSILRRFLKPSFQFPNVPKYLDQKITHEIQSLLSPTHQKLLETAEKSTKSVLLEVLCPLGFKVFSTGSFPAQVDTVDSDLDFSLVSKGMDELRDGEKLKIIQMLLKDRKEFSLVKVLMARVPLLQLVHAQTGIEIDVTIDTNDSKRNTQLLVFYGQMDPRFQPLCRAVKHWAKNTGVEGARNGRLNSFTLCLMVIHYLQELEILPNLQKQFPELSGEFEVESDDYEKRDLKKELESRRFKGQNTHDNRSLCSLYLGFLVYYSQFDFSTKWISINRGKAFQKRRTLYFNTPKDGMPNQTMHLTVQDPCLLDWNCAGSVWSREIAQRLRAEFQLSLERIKKTRGFFGGLKSPQRAQLEREGMKRDLQIEQWKKEHQEDNKRRSELRDDKWGSDVWDPNFEGSTTWDWMFPYEMYEHPKKYWDQKEHESLVEPWPVVERIMMPF